jgi:hypothetical protein
MNMTRVFFIEVCILYLMVSKFVLSRAINFGHQCHFKIWLDCHKFKKFPCLIMPMSTKCQKNERKKQEKNDN